MNTTTPLIISYIILAAAMLLTGCKVSTQHPATLPMPASFDVQTPKHDSAQNIASVPIHQFFNDPYLKDLIDLALRENLDSKIALQRISMARAGLRLSRGAFLPAINAVVTAGNKRFGDYTMDAIGNYETNNSGHLQEDQIMAEHLPDYYAGFQTSWELDVWGKLRNHKRAAAARLLASEKGRQWIITMVVSEVASLYYELLALDNEIEIVGKNILLQERALEVILVQKTAGRANELGVKQVAAQLLNTKGLRASIRQRIVETENRLNALLARYPQTIQRGKPIMEQQLPKVIGTGIPSQMLARRPDIRQAEFDLVATKADVRAARAAFFPSLSVTGAVGLQSFRAAHFFEPGALAYSVFGGLTAPLLNRNKLRSDYQVTTASSVEAFYNYQRIIITSYQEVINNLSMIENYDSIANFKQQEVNALYSALSASNDLFATSFATYLEVITAQRSVLEAELSLANTRKVQFQAAIGLYRSLGGGWE